MSFFIVLIDQVTKYLVMDHIPLHRQIPIIDGFFSLVHVHNTGAAWGMLRGLNGYLIALSIIVLIIMTLFRRVIMEDVFFQRIAAGLIIGGIIGNLFDRLHFGRVIDFLDFHLYGNHFPSFNVADSAICVGAGIYILSQIISAKKQST
ncbi:MAG: signal peptidase II [Kiritimatiellae bacterium]|nr:signal peptidase II [Kiritimatiellia bacterium]